MGMRRAQDRRPREPVEAQVVEIGAASGDEARILAPLGRVADGRDGHIEMSRDAGRQARPGVPALSRSRDRDLPETLTEQFFLLFDILMVRRILVVWPILR